MKKQLLLLFVTMMNLLSVYEVSYGTEEPHCTIEDVQQFATKRNCILGLGTESHSCDNYAYNALIKMSLAGGAVSGFESATAEMLRRRLHPSVLKRLEMVKTEAQRLAPIFDNVFKIHDDIDAQVTKKLSRGQFASWWDLRNKIFSVRDEIKNSNGQMADSKKKIAENLRILIVKISDEIENVWKKRIESETHQELKDAMRAHSEGSNPVGGHMNRRIQTVVVKLFPNQGKLIADIYKRRNDAWLSFVKSGQPYGSDADKQWQLKQSRYNKALRKIADSSPEAETVVKLMDYGYRHEGYSLSEEFSSIKKSATKATLKDRIGTVERLAGRIGVGLLAGAAASLPIEYGTSAAKNAWVRSKLVACQKEMELSSQDIQILGQHRPFDSPILTYNGSTFGDVDCSRMSIENVEPLLTELNKKHLNILSHGLCRQIRKQDQSLEKLVLLGSQRREDGAKTSFDLCADQSSFAEQKGALGLAKLKPQNEIESDKNHSQYLNTDCVVSSNLFPKKSGLNCWQNQIDQCLGISGPSNLNCRPTAKLLRYNLAKNFCQPSQYRTESPIANELAIR